MGIRKRIIAACVILISLFLIKEGVNWISTGTVMKKTNDAYQFKSCTMYLQGIFRGINEFIIDEGEPLSIQLTQKNLDGFENNFKELIATLDDNNLKQVVNEKIAPQWKVVKEGVESFLKIKYISVRDDGAMLKYGSLTTLGNALLTEIEQLADQTQQTAAATAKRIKYIITFVAVIIVAFVCLLLLNLYRAISSPIHELNVIAEGFENGDLSRHMDDSRNDEFGTVARHFNKAVTNLSAMIRKVIEVAGILTVSTEKLTSLSQVIAENAAKQAAHTEQTASAIEELNRSFIDVTKNTTDASVSSKDASDLAVQGGKVVEKTIHGMSEIARSVNDSAGVIEALGKRSEQIGEIIKVINDIAGQTNLLALNAAIEAARAGEQGRGFAVVADEVRKLAERTTSATKDIGDMINGIQQDTRKAVESMQAGTCEVTNGVNLANQAGESLTKIVRSVQNVTCMVEQIAAAAEEQSSTGEEISASVESYANLANAAAESARESSAATQALSDLAGQLQQKVNAFKLKNSSQESYIRQGSAQNTIS